MPKDGIIAEGLKEELKTSFLSVRGNYYVSDEYQDRQNEILAQESGMVIENPMLRTSQTADLEDEEERRKRNALSARFLSVSTLPNLSHNDIISGLKDLISSETAWLDLMKRAREEIPLSENGVLSKAFNPSFIQRSEARITSRMEILEKLENEEMKPEEIPADLRLELNTNAKAQIALQNSADTQEFGAPFKPSGMHIG